MLPAFRGVAVHDAWSPYDTYLVADHQLCCAHAARELQAVADATPERDWCWATQVAEALVEMQKLVTSAAAAGRDTIHPAALAEQIRLYRSAAQIGANQTAARSTKLMRATTRWPDDCSTARTTTCGSPPTGEYRQTTTDPSAISA